MYLQRMFWYPTFNKEFINNLRVNGRIIIVCNCKVYDFTEYLKNHIHPGSNEIIERFSKESKNCIDDYNFHHRGAQHKWNTYFIGYLEPI